MTGETRHRDAPTIAAWLLTVGYLAFIGTLAWHKWDKVVALEPNAIGDALAGAAAPLAFLWLVVGYYLQRTELQLQRDALNLQAEELRASASALREQAKASKRQADLFEAQLAEMKRQFDAGNAPDLVVRAIGNGNPDWTVRLMNEGGTARSFALRSYAGDWALVGEHPAVSRLDAGAERQFVIQKRHPNAGSLHVSFEYQFGESTTPFVAGFVVDAQGFVKKTEDGPVR